MRSFSLVLLRRFLFRQKPSASGRRSGQYSTLCGELSLETLRLLEGLLLHSLSHERSPSVRRSGIGVICELAKQGIARKHQWDALEAQVVSMAQMLGESKDIGGSRQAAFRVIAGCPDLVIDLEIDTVVVILQRGLQDQYSIEVWRINEVVIGFTDKISLGTARCPSCIHLLLKSHCCPQIPGMSYFGHLNVRLSSYTYLFRLLIALPIHFFIINLKLLSPTYLPQLFHLTLLISHVLLYPSPPGSC
jgi:hypothetical protein